jgi:hypothetical protein
MAEPTYVEGTETTSHTGFTKPSVVTNDWMVIFASGDDDASLAFSVTGWTTVYAPTATRRIGCFIRKVDGSEGAGPYTVTNGNGMFWFGGSIGVLSGADGTTPNTDSGTATGTGTSGPTGTVVDFAHGDCIGFYQLVTDGGATSGNPSAAAGGSVAQQYSLDGGDSELWLETGTATTPTGAQYTHAWSGSRGWICGFVVFQATASAVVRPPWRVPQSHAVMRAAHY